MSEEWKNQHENNALKQEFKQRGLDPGEVLAGDPDDIERENRMLRALLDWVDAYRACPDREKLAKQGYEFPPVDPDWDPDTDWLRFERWVNGDPTAWDVSKEVLTTDELNQMSDEQVKAAFARLCEFLESRGVVVDFADELPARLAYQEVAEALAEGPIPFMGPGSAMHLDGCDGCCPGCVRRPWCEPGGELCWPEDEEAGHIVFPDAVKPYVSPAPGSLALLKAAEEV